MTNKMTRKDYFNAIMDGTLDHDLLVAFCEKEIAAIDHKADKARERAALKATEPDVLMDAVLGVLTDEPMTVNDILGVVSIDGATAGKIANRASRLVKDGKAVKTTVTVTGEDGGKARKLVAYTLA